MSSAHKKIQQLAEETSAVHNAADLSLERIPEIENMLDQEETIHHTVVQTQNILKRYIQGKGFFTGYVAYDLPL